MTTTSDHKVHRVGSLRPNQLLHTYGVGAIADLPNLSVVMLGLDNWSLTEAKLIEEERLLAAVRDRLGNQVQTLRQPPHKPETGDVFAEWARVGVPVSVFPGWLRCSDTRCNYLGRNTFSVFELLGHSFAPDKIRYVHNCRGSGGKRPTAVPARFVLACPAGHLDDFPWHFFVHKGHEPGGDHTLTLTESGTTGEAASIYINCSCGSSRPMSDALGKAAVGNLPLCRGRHPHLSQFEPCQNSTRTLALGATNSWFAMQLRAFSLPRAEEPLKQVVAEFWGQLQLLAALPESVAKPLMRTQTCWAELESFGEDAAWDAIKDHVVMDDEKPDEDDRKLLWSEWQEFSSGRQIELPDFTTRREPAPPSAKGWLEQVILVPRLREVSALYGFTRIDAPEWGELGAIDPRRAPLSEQDPSWVPCAEVRGEGIFLRFSEARLAQWENRDEVRERERAILRPAHDLWREQRGLEQGHWPQMRYVLLHSFAHSLIRELALESGYSASGIGERVYARSGDRPMSGILLYTAAPDSEGTLGGLVSLGRKDSLGALIERALDAAGMCTSDPLCSEHDPREHGRLYGAACHACLFAAETSCERGNQYLDRTLLVETLSVTGCGFFP